MRTTRAALIGIVFLLITFFFISSVYAGGWHKLGPKEENSTDVFDPDSGLWSSKSDYIRERVPHLDLSSSSNNCRTCHAVHNADNIGKGLGADDLTTPDPQLGPELTGNGQSFKLLRNESRKSECFFCHWTEGALTEPKKKPYAPMIGMSFKDTNGDGVPDTWVQGEIQPKGEHTLGALEIPDSTVDQTFLAGDGLQCGTCHSVHGGWTLNGVVPYGSPLNTRILRRDPAQNGNGPQGQGAAGGVYNVQDIDANNKPIATTPKPGETYPGSNQLGPAQILTAFCGDCHNKNVNWDRGGYFGVYAGNTVNASHIPPDEGERPNKMAHPLGKVDELIDVYGKLKIVAFVTSLEEGYYLTCRVCHSSGTSASKFPHQSISHKLLFEGYGNAVGRTPISPPESPLDKPGKYEQWLKPWDRTFHPGKQNAFTGDPERPLPGLQQEVCMQCHTDIGQPNNPNSF